MSNIFDAEVFELLKLEESRQKNNLQLIASENYVSPEIMYLQGSILTNKYAEGYPYRRYYGGCEYLDSIESLAIERAKALFGAAYANVQPHSGSQANQAVMAAFLNPGDLILGMSLDAGGHLTHGSKVSFSGKIYKSIHYGVNSKGVIDYDMVRDLALLHRPKLIIAGFSSYTGLVDWSFFREVADEVGAYFLADMAHVAGLVACNLYPSPINFAHVVTCTTHKTLRGPRGGLILSNDVKYARILDSAVFPNCQGGPLMHVIAAKAVCFYEALDDSFLKYQHNVLFNAKKLAKCLVGDGFNLVGSSIDNHIILIDMTSNNISGLDMQNFCDLAGISLNKNAIPNDPLPPNKSSGIRIGTPAITTRGLKEADMYVVSNWLRRCAESNNNARILNIIRNEISNFLEKYPLVKN